MTRRDVLSSVAAAAIGTSGVAVTNSLTPPASGKISVAFMIGPGATIIDFCGPWEVFQDVAAARGEQTFELYTVCDDAEITATGGMRIAPNRTFANAGEPKVIVIPAHKASPAEVAWIKKATPTADVVMSVCTGAFVLARTGLLDGKDATTHHDFFDKLATQFPDVHVKRGLRFVEGPKISSAGGLTSGIDLALRVVERYYGRVVAQQTADYMEYQGKGWIV